MFLLPRHGSRRRSSLLVTLAVGVTATLSACTFGSSSDVADPTPTPPGPAATPAAGAGSASGTATPDASASVTASATDPATDPQFAAFYGQKVTWADCKDGFQCTKVTVPVDWATPSGATIKLSVVRQRSTGKKIGSLFLNPGGPGVPGVSFLRAAASTYGASLHKAYDLVSWDTRGVGGSAPVKCLPNSALDSFFSEDATPDTPAEQTQLVDDAKKFAAACETNTGDLLKHMDTISTAKDMDVLRAVVGDQVMTYMGASYGTFMGEWYSQLFPWRVGRVVLDGVVDPSLTSAQFMQGQALGFSRALQGYVDDCLRKRGCPLKGTREEAYAQLGRLNAQIDAKPLRTDQGRPLTQALFTTGLFQALYSADYWPVATSALTEAFKGNGTTMLLLADSYMQRDDKGVYAQLLQVTSAVFCLDRPETRTVEQQAADAAALKAQYPPFGDVIGWGGVTCSQWPIPAVVPAEKLAAQGSRPILVVGSTGDPATPYEWAQSVASQLANGHLLTRKGQGHTGYGMGSKCTDRAVEAYLVGGVVPKNGTVCS